MLNLIDGREITSSWEGSYDVVIIGSGPAGAAVARTLAMSGVKVLVIEEGPWVKPADFPTDSFSAMTALYRDMGASLLLGSAPMPFLQGRAVGGSSVINGAISWRLPQDVQREWLSTDPALEETLSWETLTALFDEIEADLNIKPTAPEIAGLNNSLLGVGAVALGLEHRPIARNVRGCRGLGRCLQGCPEGYKLSMDRSYLPEACEHGALILSSVTAKELVISHGRIVGVIGRSAGGAEVKAHASRAVVLAASAIQTPALLLANGLRHGPVGKNFQCHPGASMAGRFSQAVKMWTGATQGHEVIGLRREGIKFEALGYDMSIVATRTKGIGKALSADLAELAHFANWGAAVRATSRGVVKAGWRGKARCSFSLGVDDMKKVRRGVRFLGEMMLAAGAQYVTPGVFGWHEKVSDRNVMARFEAEGPLDPKAYSMAVTHMFGTCRMGADPATSVVRPDFRHHTVDGLYIADSSVFPSNTGVNPQTSILALATLCARSIRDS